MTLEEIADEIMTEVLDVYELRTLEDLLSEFGVDSEGEADEGK